MIRRLGKLFSLGNVLILALVAASLQVIYWPAGLTVPLAWMDWQLTEKIYSFTPAPTAPIPVYRINLSEQSLTEFSRNPGAAELTPALAKLAQRGTMAVFLTEPLNYAAAPADAGSRPFTGEALEQAEAASAPGPWAGLMEPGTALWVLPQDLMVAGSRPLGRGWQAVGDWRWRGYWSPSSSRAMTIPGPNYHYGHTEAVPAQSVVWRSGDDWFAGLSLALLIANEPQQMTLSQGRLTLAKRGTRALGPGGQLPVDARLSPALKSLDAALTSPSAIWLLATAQDTRPDQAGAALQTLVLDHYPKTPAWGQWLPLAVLSLLALGLLGWWLRASGWILTIYCVVGAAALVAGQWAAQFYLNWWLPMPVALGFLAGVWLLGMGWRLMQWPYRSVLASWRNAWQQIVRRQLQEGQLEAAELHLTALQDCRTEPWQLQLTYEVAQSYEKQRRYDQAGKLYSAIVTRSGGFADVKERLKRLQELSSGQGTTGLDATLVIDETIINKPVLGRYEIQKELGRGAMGVVYLARDPRIGRMVAVKTLHYKHFEPNQLDGVKARFYREAEAAGRLSHPNIVSVFDVGEESDLSYIAMDFVPGKALNFYCSPQRLLPVPIVYGLMAKAADALYYAHKHHIVHRDIKPSNLLYDAETGRMKVSDFGIARLVDNSKTRTGDVMGSPLYMSPEQLKGNKVAEHADIYSLGVTMYQLLTGKLPYDGDSLANLTYNILQGKHASVRSHRPELPASATRITNKALQKDIADRYSSAREMAEALRKSLARDFNEA